MWSALAEPLSFDAHPAKNMKPAIRIASFCIVLLLCFAAGAPGQTTQPVLSQHCPPQVQFHPHAPSRNEWPCRTPHSNQHPFPPQAAPVCQGRKRKHAREPNGLSTLVPLFLATNICP